MGMRVTRTVARPVRTLPDALGPDKAPGRSSFRPFWDVVDRWVTAVTPAPCSI
jgi:hypothetical protein